MAFSSVPAMQSSARVEEEKNVFVLYDGIETAPIKRKAYVKLMQKKGQKKTVRIK